VPRIEIETSSAGFFLGRLSVETFSCAREGGGCCFEIPTSLPVTTVFAGMASTGYSDATLNFRICWLSKL
jgi:hypothetical protein